MEPRQRFQYIATHPDMKSHTGECLVAKDGVLHSRSTKQKLNSKSSTEAELIGVSEYLPYPLWILHFLKYQGYMITTVNLKQDNQSTIKMLKSGIRSAGAKSRHINFTFFWISDRLKIEKIKLQYIPTELMLEDFFTKALQGKLFENMRDVIHGLKDKSILNQKKAEEKQHQEFRKERVENKKNERNLNMIEEKIKSVRFGESPGCANDDETVVTTNSNRKINATKTGSMHNRFTLKNK